MKQRIRFIMYKFMVFSTLLICISCGKNTVTLKENQCYIYYVNKDGDGLTREIYDLTPSNEKVSETVSKMLTELSKGEESYKVKNPINATCKILNSQIREQQLILNFDTSYYSMDVIEELLHRAAIVKSLTQLEGVDEIQFTIDEQPLTINKKSVGFMKGQDFISNVAGNGVMKKTTISLYFANEKGDALVEVPADIIYDATIPLGQLMISELLKGPEAIGNLKEKGLQRTLSENVECNSITIRDNICYIDFNKEFENFTSDLNHEIIIYSVVNLLSELPNVNKVQFTVEGEYIELIGEALSMNLPFERNLDIVTLDEKVPEVEIKSVESNAAETQKVETQEKIQDKKVKVVPQRGGKER